MWSYDQMTGQLAHDAENICYGYSGCGAGLDNPLSQHVQDVGPVPRGKYTIGAPVDTLSQGPFVLPLTPDQANEMFGRSGFLIHGDNHLRNHSASKGCIVISPVAVRERIAASGDSELQVK